MNSTFSLSIYHFRSLINNFIVNYVTLSFICVSEPRTECEIERELVYNRAFMINRQYPVLPFRAFLPSCDKDGEYKNTQCHGRYCWCINRRGKEVIGTRTRSRKLECKRCKLLFISLAGVLRGQLRGEGSGQFFLFNLEFLSIFRAF